VNERDHVLIVEVQKKGEKEKCEDLSVMLCERVPHRLV